MVIESSSLVPVLFREVFSHPYISFFYLLVNGFFVTCFHFFFLTVTELSIRGTQVTIWIIMTKEIDVAGKASYKLSSLSFS